MSDVAEAWEGRATDMRLATRVAAVAEIADIRLFSTHCDLKAFPSGQGQLSFELELTFTNNVEGEPGAAFEGGAFAVEGDIRLDLIELTSDPAAGSDELEVGHLRVGFGALYNVEEPSSGPLTVEEVNGFTQSLAAMAIIPYAREYFADVTRRMGLPQLTLPIVRLPSPWHLDETAPEERPKEA